MDGFTSEVQQKSGHQVHQTSVLKNAEDTLAAASLVHQSLHVTSLHALHWQGASALAASDELCRRCCINSVLFVTYTITRMYRKKGGAGEEYKSEKFGPFANNVILESAHHDSWVCIYFVIM